MVCGADASVPPMKLTPNKLEVLQELSILCPLFKLSAPVWILQLSWWFQTKGEKESVREQPRSILPLR